MKLINTEKNILIVGLGLLGGSYAIALKKKGFCVNAITRKQSSIDYAIEHGMIDRGAVEPDAELIGRANVIIFALYPHVFKEWIKSYGGLIQPGTIVTDVTGVKSSIVYEIQGLLPDGVEFIAAHPMAGREVSGVENATDEIFRGANYIVVPTDRNTEGAIDFCKDLGNILGFKSVSVLTPEKHDKMIAFLSQLTHCIAVSLMCTSDDPELVSYTGDSFRDLTRIADINDEMWSELFLLNKDSLLCEMDAYRKEFDRLYDYIKDGDEDGMRQMMRLSSVRRRKFNKKA